MSSEIVKRFWTPWMFLALTIKSSCSVEKYWLPNLEWETAENWLGKRIPELDSYVTFPLDMRHAVGIGSTSNLRLSGIDLARSGALVLPRNGKLQLSEPKTPRKTSEWLRAGNLFWADPQNWNGNSEAAPHLEQVPCRQDDIVLPEKNRTFSTLLPLKNIEVRSVRMNDEKRPLSEGQWIRLRNRREFAKGIFTVMYAKYNCEKCSCQNDPYGYYLEEICAIERPKCGYTPCEYPLTVEGHCCQYCGARVSLSAEASVLMVHVTTDVALAEYADNLAWHVRRTWNGQVEVLLKKKGDYSEIDVLKAAQDVKESLQSMKMKVLGMEVTGAALKDNRLTVALVPFFMTPFIVLFVVFLGCIYFGYSYRHILLSCIEFSSSIRDEVRADKAEGGKPFGFARFENVSEGNVQISNIDVATEPKEVLEEEGQEESPTSGGRFENPLYRSKRRGHKEDEEVLSMEALVQLTTLEDKAEEQLEEVEINMDE